VKFLAILAVSGALGENHYITLKEQTSKEMAVPGDWVVIAKLQV
jgi:hypothetical protein